MKTRYKNTSSRVKTLFIINYLVLINIFFIGRTSAFGAEPIIETVWGDVKAAGNDASFIGHGLVSLDIGDLAITSGIIGGTGLLMLADEDMRSLAQHNQSASANNVFSITNEAGNLLYAGGLSGGMYIGGLISGSEWTRTTGRLMIESLVLSGVFTSTLKAAFGRSRPYMNQGNMQFNWFEFKEDHWSMPSGHSSTVFSVITVLAGRIDRWWGYGLYGLAAMTMASRIYYDKHWLSDTFAGGAIGTLSGLAVLEANRERLNNLNRDKGLFIVPSTDVITFCYRF